MELGEEWTEIWGLDLAIDGAYTQIVLAGRDSLMTFRFLDISDILYFKREFMLPYVLYGRPELEANSQYFLIRTGELLTVFNSSEDDPDYTI